MAMLDYQRVCVLVKNRFQGWGPDIRNAFHLFCCSSSGKGWIWWPEWAGLSEEALKSNIWVYDGFCWSLTLGFKSVVPIDLYSPKICTCISSIRTDICKIIPKHGSRYVTPNESGFQLVQGKRLTTLDFPCNSLSLGWHSCSHARNTNTNASTGQQDEHEHEHAHEHEALPSENLTFLYCISMFNR